MRTDLVESLHHGVREEKEKKCLERPKGKSALRGCKGVITIYGRYPAALLPRVAGKREKTILVAPPSGIRPSRV